jgi:hypothetical protein
MPRNGHAYDGVIYMEDPSEAVEKALNVAGS